MCIYCKETDMDSLEREFEYEIHNQFRREHKLFLSLFDLDVTFKKKEGEEAKIDVEFAPNDIDDISDETSYQMSFPLNYCPACGRKITKEEA